MPSLRELRRRIRSIENTAKVTHAMEMIAASKMRKAQGAVLSGRPYAEKIQEVIANLEAQQDAVELVHPLLERRNVQNLTLIHFTPDRGLCGGLHGNLNRAIAEFILSKKGSTVQVIAVGRKGRDFIVRTGLNLKAEFTNMGDQLKVSDILPLSQMVLDEYSSVSTDEVYIAYPRFVSMAVQRPTIERVIPVDPSDLPYEAKVGYIYEPDPMGVLNVLLPRYIEMQIYHGLLELNASEQSARMVAMRNATDSANEMVEDLTLELNKVRQASITNELLDIIAGTIALKG